MKAWGLILSMIVVCSACTTAEKPSPIGAPLEPYVGPPISAPVGYDRAEAGESLPPLNSLVGKGLRPYLVSWR